jgi:hypothetical protein
MRSKLTLNVEDLSVDSFDTTAAAREKGTVFGEQCTCYTQCTCPGCPTCYASCNGTCGATCPATCYNTCDDNTCGCAGTDYTDCGCPDTCLQTACGPYFCCA